MVSGQLGNMMEKKRLERFYKNGLMLKERSYNK